MRLARSTLLVALALACASAAHAQSPPREHLAPPGWEGSYHGIHYSPVVKLGDRVIVSGIPAIEGDTDEAKIRWLFQQLQAHLEKAGAGLEDVVELQSFHLAQDNAEFRAQMDIVLKVHAEFFKDRYPAWTAVGTTALFTQGAPMELRAEAVIGSGRTAKVSIPAPKSRPRPAQ